MERCWKVVAEPANYLDARRSIWHQRRDFRSLVRETSVVQLLWDFPCLQRNTSIVQLPSAVWPIADVLIEEVVSLAALPAGSPCGSTALVAGLFVDGLTEEVETWSSSYSPLSNWPREGSAVGDAGCSANARVLRPVMLPCKSFCRGSFRVSAAFTRVNHGTDQWGGLCGRRYTRSLADPIEAK